MTFSEYDKTVSTSIPLQEETKKNERKKKSILRPFLNLKPITSVASLRFKTPSTTRIQKVPINIKSYFAFSNCNVIIPAHMFRNKTVTFQHHQHQLMVEENEEEKDNNKKKKKKKEKRLVLRRPSVDDHRTNRPLEDFNTRITSRSSATILNNTSFNKTSVFIEAPRGGCRRFPLSSNSSSCSSSRSHLQIKPKSFPKITTKTTLNSASSRSNKTFTANENDLHKKLSTQDSQNNPSFLYRCQSCKVPAAKTASQRSKLSSTYPKNSSSGRYGLLNQPDLKKKGPKSHRGLVGEPASTHFNLSVTHNLNSIEDCSPVGKLACGPRLNHAVVHNDYDQPAPVGGDSNSANSTTVKTPPVEASVSPEIQCGGGSAHLVASLTATPVCYGAGHIISGVTDKRKCRPRGILTVGGPTNPSGCGNVSFCEDDSNGTTDVVFTKSRTSLIPLPVEASMKWLLSPQDNEDKFQKDDSVNGHTPFTDLASMCVSSVVIDSGDKNGSGNQDAITSAGKTGIVVLSPRRIPNFYGREKFGETLVTPQAKSCCRTDNRQKGGDRSYGFMGDQTPPCVDPLSCSNVIQTLTSDSSLDGNAAISWMDADDYQTSESNPELGPVAEIFHGTNVSPRSQVQVWDPPGLSSQFTDLTSPSCSIDPIQLHKNLVDCASWISDTTVGTVSLSQMRISWQEGLASRAFDTDELDCCICLSDEENYGDKSDEFQHMSSKAFEVEKRDSLGNSNLRSPEFLENESEILRKGKDAFPPVGTNVCAESISTDAGGLVASEDSDWIHSYKTQLFEV